MNEISRYDIELFLDQYNISLIDCYISNPNELTLEIERGGGIDKEMVIAEMALMFEQFEHISFDNEFKTFLIILYDNIKLID